MTDSPHPQSHLHNLVVIDANFTTKFGKLKIIIAKFQKCFYDNTLNFNLVSQNSRRFARFECYHENIFRNFLQILSKTLSEFFLQ
jgi:hypothetical protein